MARRKSNRLRSPSGRDVVKSPPIASRRLPRRIHVRTVRQLQLDLARFMRNDNRAYSPQRGASRSFRPASLTLSGRIADTKIDKYSPLRSARFSFVAPEKVVTCVRRGVRKEVLHAFGVAGKRGIKSRRRTSTSTIKC